MTHELEKNTAGIGLLSPTTAKQNGVSSSMYIHPQASLAESHPRNLCTMCTIPRLQDPVHVTYLPGVF